MVIYRPYNRQYNLLSAKRELATDLVLCFITRAIGAILCAFIVGENWRFLASGHNK